MSSLLAWLRGPRTWFEDVEAAAQSPAPGCGGVIAIDGHCSRGALLQCEGSAATFFARRTPRTSAGAARVRSEIILCLVLGQTGPAAAMSARSEPRLRVPRPSVRPPHACGTDALVVGTEEWGRGFLGQLSVLLRHFPLSFGPLCRVLHLAIVAFVPAATRRGRSGRPRVLADLTFSSERNAERSKCRLKKACS
jgi:hypothetical protein